MKITDFQMTNPLSKINYLAHNFFENVGLGINSKIRKHSFRIVLRCVPRIIIIIQTINYCDSLNISVNYINLSKFIFFKNGLSLIKNIQSLKFYVFYIFVKSFGRIPILLI